jgi:hypothetical protein
MSCAPAQQVLRQSAVYCTRRLSLNAVNSMGCGRGGAFRAAKSRSVIAGSRRAPSTGSRTTPTRSSWRETASASDSGPAKAMPIGPRRCRDPVVGGPPDTIRCYEVVGRLSGPGIKVVRILGSRSREVTTHAVEQSGRSRLGHCISRAGPGEPSEGRQPAESRQRRPTGVRWRPTRESAP